MNNHRLIGPYGVVNYEDDVVEEFDVAQLTVPKSFLANDGQCHRQPDLSSHILYAFVNINIATR